MSQIAGYCASEDCDSAATERFETGGIGSAYCARCAAKVRATLSSLPTGDMETLVELVLGRIGQDFDGEAHFTEAEARSIASSIQALIAERDAFRDALTKINAIRSSIIGFQSVNWSAHIYPLVAALQEAGFEGDGYDVAREKAKSFVDQVNAATSRAEASEARAKELAKALETARADALEEAAKVADDEDQELTQWGEDRNSRVSQQTSRDIAAAIRRAALAEQTQQPKGPNQ